MSLDVPKVYICGRERQKRRAALLQRRRKLRVSQLLLLPLLVHEWVVLVAHPLSASLQLLVCAERGL